MLDSLRRGRPLTWRRYVAATTLAAIALVVPRTTHAFCRTTTTIPADYSPSPSCFSGGLPLYWRGACVGYSVNTAASANIPLAEATRVIDAAFASWNGVTCAGTGTAVGIAASNLGSVTCSEVRYNQNGPNQNVIVFRDDGWPYNDPNNTLGLTTVTFNADTGEIFDADMEINSSGKNLSTSANVPANGFDLLSVVTHEVGHFFGLTHAPDATATMFASYKPGSSALRTLSADDAAGLCAIYPNATTRSVAKSVDKSGSLAATACDPSPRHGFSAACDSNPAPSDSSSGGGCAVASASTFTSRTDVLGGLGLALVVVMGLRRRGRTESGSPL